MGRLLLAASLALSAGHLKAQAQGETWPDDAAAEMLGVRGPVRTQSRFLMGTSLGRSGSLSSNVPLAGVLAESVRGRLTAGTALVMQFGGLGPKGSSGAFVDIAFRKRSILLDAPASPELGTLNSLGLLLSPNLGRRIPLGSDRFLRPYLEFGAGTMLHWFDVPDPSLYPAPPADAQRQFNASNAFAWKAGLGVDLGWSDHLIFAFALTWLGDESTVEIESSSGGPELGRLKVRASALQWTAGLAYGF